MGWKTHITCRGCRAITTKANLKSGWKTLLRLPPGWWAPNSTGKGLGPIATMADDVLCPTCAEKYFGLRHWPPCAACGARRVRSSISEFTCPTAECEKARRIEAAMATDL